MRTWLAAHRDVWLGVAVVAAMSAAYLWTGEFALNVPPAVSATAIVPIVTCVARDSVNAGSFIAKFGYERADGAPTVTVAYANAGAVLNFISVGGNPLPQRYGVPTEFQIGSHASQIEVRALDTQTVIWTLTSDQTRAAVATSQSQPACASSDNRPR